MAEYDQLNALLDEVLARARYHADIARNHYALYRNLGTILTIAVPIGAFAVSLVSKFRPCTSMLIFIVSGIVGILSSINALLKPSKRAKHNVEYLLKFIDFVERVRVARAAVGEDDTEPLRIIIEPAQRELVGLIERYTIDAPQLASD